MAEITREVLEQHIVQIRSQLTAYQGALQFAEALLGEIDAPVEDGPAISYADLQEAIKTAEIAPVNGHD